MEGHFDSGVQSLKLSLQSVECAESHRPGLRHCSQLLARVSCIEHSFEFFSLLEMLYFSTRSLQTVGNR